MARKCTRCGADIRDGVAFCTECGAKASEAVQSVAANTCTNCGAPMKEGVAFCTSCGAKQAEVVPTASVTPPPPPPVTPPPAPPRQEPPRQEPPPAAPVYQAPPPAQQPVQPVYQQPAQAAPQQTLEQSVKGTKYEPITTGGFVGIMLLLCIPVVGLILLIVWACGGCRKISKRSFARANLILGIIMTVLGLVIGLIFGSLIQSFLKNAGIDTSGLPQGSSWNIENDVQKQNKTDDDNPLSALGDLGSLLGGLESLEGLTGQGDSGGSDWSDLIGNVEDINKDVQSDSDGWPETLRAYPGGTSIAVESYRTEITGTTLEEMKTYIGELKEDGYKYQDFYDFGFTEEDMLAINGWWGTNGEIYLSLSFSEGTVIVDHTYELPNYDFG